MRATPKARTTEINMLKTESSSVTAMPLKMTGWNMNSPTLDQSRFSFAAWDQMKSAAIATMTARSPSARRASGAWPGFRPPGRPARVLDQEL
ncbi:hypothetical protein AHiyo8_40950 [Arthrobacter sp. Hiyo8]|nr:hypothetical protein AHiyo8_40950 [Arthrobacter sp. Hiyo8]